jgi:hypothetical protein
LSADFGLAVQRLSPILEIGSESSQWWSPMAIAVIFGLGVATLLTLVVVPVLCSMAYSVFGAPGAGPTSISPLRRWWLKRKGIDIHHGDDLMGPRIQDVEEEETAGPAGQTVDPKS